MQTAALWLQSITANKCVGEPFFIKVLELTGTGNMYALVTDNPFPSQHNTIRHFPVKSPLSETKIEIPSLHTCMNWLVGGVFYIQVLSAVCGCQVWVVAACAIITPIWGKTHRKAPWEHLIISFDCHMLSHSRGNTLVEDISQPVPHLVIGSVIDKCEGTLFYDITLCDLLMWPFKCCQCSI